jgi:flavin reductase (DIM6/NTAB) family NADH-FMN oxidoreductase RutF
MDVTAAGTLIAWLDREIWLLTAQVDDGQWSKPTPNRGGLVATFVGAASIVADLPRMIVGLAQSHHTWELVEASGAFALHLMGEQHLELVWRFGLQSGRDIDKLDGLNLVAGATGSPILEDSLGWMSCRVESRQHTGDRTIYLAEVLESRVTHFGPPLTQKRLLQLAPPHHLAELKRQLHQDGVLDAEAIRRWRSQRNGF